MLPFAALLFETLLQITLILTNTLSHSTDLPLDTTPQMQAMQPRKRIMLVEDDEDDQYLFCESLMELHPEIECQIAQNGAEALELVKQLPPFDMIFLDLNMPKVDGFECL